MVQIESFLTALNDAAPSGPDLKYDGEFMALEQAARGKPGDQYGDTVIPPQEPDWPTVLNAAEQLLGRSRDLRVALIWTRAATRTGGFEGFSQGVSLIEGMLTRLWPSVHPQLDADDNNDATMRMNALAGLAAPEGLLGDVRAAWIGAQRGASALRVRDLELALARAEPNGDELVPTEDGVRAALSELAAGQDQLCHQCAAADQAVASIASTLDAQAGAAAAPDLQRLRELTRLVSQAAQAAAPAGQAEDGLGGQAAGARAGLKGRIESREDALQALDRVCEWLARTEPTNPAPLVIRRAQRLMTMNFLEIVRDIAPGGVDQVLTVIGPEAGQK